MLVLGIMLMAGSFSKLPAGHLRLSSSDRTTNTLKRVLQPSIYNYSLQTAVECWDQTGHIVGKTFHKFIIVETYTFMLEPGLHFISPF